MMSDLAWLPAPASLDPLLLHWFGVQLPWGLDAATRAEAESVASCGTRELAAAYDPRVSAASDEQQAWLRDAESLILSEAARAGILPTPTEFAEIRSPR